MNQSQLKYARERAQKIKRDRQNANIQKFQAQQLPDEERIAAIQRGDFSIRATVTRATYVYDILEIHGETPEDRAGLALAQEKLETEFTKLMDELVLGDNEQALALLREFSAE